MSKFFITIVISVFLVSLSCKNEPQRKTTSRFLVDTIGFAQYPWQMDSVIARIDSSDKQPTNEIYKAAICPHDDYAYAAGLFNKTLAGIKAKTIILVGVAHRARNFDLENKVIFGTYKEWDSPYGSVQISPLRDQWVSQLKKETYIIHDEIMQQEHSLEAITPFLQKNNKEVEIIPLLVPAMTFENMKLFSQDLSSTMAALLKTQNLEYGNDVAIVISSDAIHYGDEGWGGANMAPYGVDSIGNEKAREKDLRITQNCLIGAINTNRIKVFNQYTVSDSDFRAYKWTWCGRYSVPLGMLFANQLNENLTNQPLNGTLIDWRSSLHNTHIEVVDIGMGHTAAANANHWVAFIGVGYQ